MTACRSGSRRENPAAMLNHEEAIPRVKRKLALTGDLPGGDSRVVQLFNPPIARQ